MAIEVISTLVPKNNGSFPVVEDTHTLGGWHVVVTIVERDAITSARRKEGMPVYVVETDTVYKLTGGISNTNWSVWLTLEQARRAGATLAGDINMGGYAVENVGIGVDNYAAAQKRWVLDQISAGATPSLSPLNRGMQATTTSADNSLACVTALMAAPPTNGWLLVLVNGLSYAIGNGTKATVPCYFSHDGGLTPRATGAVTTGDLLYWNGSVAGFQLSVTDRIDFVFEAL